MDTGKVAGLTRQRLSERRGQIRIGFDRSAGVRERTETLRTGDRLRRNPVRAGSDGEAQGRAGWIRWSFISATSGDNDWARVPLPSDGT